MNNYPEIKSGIINVYKEAGYTSVDVVARLRGILRIKKIGHTGTLDPDATGVLPICVGKATGLVEYLSDHDKVYESVFLLGQTTDTLDISGKVLARADYSGITPEAINDAIKAFVGEIDQIPPMYSALKQDGKKLYELARKGIEVERKPRRVTVHSIDVLAINLPEISVRIHCSKGTYIRSICDDLGRALGCGACMKSLKRTKVGSFEIDSALTLDCIEKLKNNADFKFLSPIESVFGDMKRFHVKEEAVKYAVNGAVLNADEIASENDEFSYIGKLLLYLPDDRFVGLYESDGQNIKILKMFLEQ